MKTEKLRIKDLVTIGVFTVIYFVLMFASGMIGMVPILYLAYPTLAGIITGIVVMLFMAKESSKTVGIIYTWLDLQSYCSCNGEHICNSNTCCNQYGDC